MDSQLLGCLVMMLAALSWQQSCVGAYKVLMIPIPGRSHLFSMAAVAEGLASRGHRVSLLVGENFPADDLPEVRDWSTIRIVRYDDSRQSGAAIDYEAVFENVTTHAMVRHVDMWSLVPVIRNKCVLSVNVSVILLGDKPTGQVRWATTNWSTDFGQHGDSVYSVGK